ncbi:MAG: peptide deformylase [Eggerthellaceae bacterium]|nr:peptide deformylase [Eggerthellaceae bacterium]
MLSIMRIITYPNPILSKVASPCVVGDPSLRKLAKGMADLMYRANGVGIAAPQVGVSKRLIVVDCDLESEEQNPIVLVNPEIILTKGEEEIDDEGCLSVPGISVPIKRKPWVKVNYFDLDGRLQTIESDGLLGRCLQHEIDHLNGVTLIESSDPQDKEETLARYEEALKNHAKPGDVG